MKDQHFAFQLNALLLEDYALYLVHHRHHVLKRSVAAVDNKPAVLLADLRPADGESLQTALLYEPGRLNVLPQLGKFSACLSRQRCISSSIRDFISALSPGTSSIVTEVITMLLPLKTLWR